MTDKEIIKALECCSEAKFKADCKKLKCPFFDNEIYNCMNIDDENAMHRYSLDLINRQKVEIERLKAEADELEIQKDYLYDEAKALIERDKQSKSEAIREFAEKLKTKIAGLEVKSPNETYKFGMEDVLYYRMPKIINSLVIEMTEVNDGH